jgi:hypothetical protein
VDDFASFGKPKCDRLQLREINWAERMLDPLVTAALGFVFGEFVKSGVGELGKKATGEGLAKVQELRKLVWAKFKGDAKAERALGAIEQEGSEAALRKLETYVDDAIEDDPVFAERVQQLAQQIVNIQNQGTIERQYNNSGRDQINIETIQGNPTIGG